MWNKLSTAQQKTILGALVAGLSALAVAFPAYGAVFTAAAGLLASPLGPLAPTEKK